MKKYITLFLFIFSFSCTSNESSLDSKTTNDETPSESTIVEPDGNYAGEIKGDFIGCGYENANSSNSIKIYTPGKREVDQINVILKFTGLNSNYSIYAADIKNAMAVIIKKKRYILYDPRLLSYTDNTSGSFWSSMSILAHEIGHHLSGHTLNNGSDSHRDELEADKFSGFVLYKMGASLAQAKAAINLLGSQSDSESHPGKQKRFYAIEKGWNEANDQRHTSAIPPPPSDETNGIPDYTMSEFFWTDFVSCVVNNVEDDPFGSELQSAIKNEATYVGIIIDAKENNDPDAYKLCGGFRKDVVIEITDVLKKSSYSYTFKKGERIEAYTDYLTAGFANSAFEILFIPGRKIMFRSFQYYRNTNTLFYIKRLSRTKNETPSYSNQSGYNIQETTTSRTNNNIKSYIVTSFKAYFYNSPDYDNKRKAYLVAGEKVTSLQTQNGFIYISFTNANGRTSSGWISLSDVTEN